MPNIPEIPPLTPTRQTVVILATLRVCDGVDFRCRLSDGQLITFSFPSMPKDPQAAVEALGPNYLLVNQPKPPPTVEEELAALRTEWDALVASAVKTAGEKMLEELRASSIDAKVQETVAAMVGKAVNASAEVLP